MLPVLRGHVSHTVIFSLFCVFCPVVGTKIEQATFASKIELVSDTHALVTREVDGGLEVLRVALPSVISTDLRLNNPRYATLPNIMKAKKKPIETLDLESLSLDLAPRNVIIRVEAPQQRQGGVMVDSVDALVDKLRNEAKVL